MATATVTTVASGNPPFFGPRGIAFNPTSPNILFVVAGLGKICTIDTSNSNSVTTLTLTGVSLQFAGPSGITFDSVGNSYVACSNGNISKLVLTSGTTYSCTNLTLTGETLSGPQGITIDSLGNLYVANLIGNSISKLVLTSGTTYSCTNLTLTGGTLSGPYGITFDSLGNLYVANGASNSISKLVLTSGTTYSCTTLTLTGGTLSGVRGLSFDSYGDLYVANLSNNTISKIVLTGTSGTVSTYISSGLDNPFDLAFNSSNYLYISNSNSSNSSIVATTSPSCFNHDTKILCLNKELQEQYVPIQDLRKGDVVKTYLHGYREIQFIGKGACSNNPHVWYGSMYKMEKTDTNGLFEDLIVTGGHAILVDQVTEEQENAYEHLGVKGFSEKIDDKFLLLAAGSDQFVQLTDNEMYTYYHLVIENDGDDNQKFGIWANGVLSESTTKQHYLMSGFEDL